MLCIFTLQEGKKFVRLHHCFINFIEGSKATEQIEFSFNFQIKLVLLDHVLQKIVFTTRVTATAVITKGHNCSILILVV